MSDMESSFTESARRRCGCGHKRVDHHQRLSRIVCWIEGCSCADFIEVGDMESSFPDDLDRIESKAYPLTYDEWLQFQRDCHAEIESLSAEVVRLRADLEAKNAQSPRLTADETMAMFRRENDRLAADLAAMEAQRDEARAEAEAERKARWLSRGIQPGSHENFRLDHPFTWEAK